ncbi:MAG: hypothetical protein ACKVOH_04355 [Chlamydiales bacterium]
MRKSFCFLLLFCGLFCCTLPNRGSFYLRFTVFSNEGVYKLGDGHYWGQLVLQDVDRLGSFVKMHPRRLAGKMSVEDLFAAWNVYKADSNYISIQQGELSYNFDRKQRYTFSIDLKNPQYDSSANTLTFFVLPRDPDRKIPVDVKLHLVELELYIDPAESQFWDDWIGN